jgi:TusE/DsrC/DsvC family sulfur relay protein
MPPVSPANAARKQETHHLENLQNWSVVSAYALAAEAGIKLTQQHIEALYWIRAEYDQYGCSDSATLLEKFEKDFGITSAPEYLKNLFPADPVTQWFRVAGLPLLSQTKCFID